MELAPGAELLHYRLIEPLGQGGMGVVWKARDTSLDRDVAIKLLPDHLARDATRLARFEREARSLASLNHPNIAQVYGFHELDGRHLIAMEYVPGEDLQKRLRRGPLEIDACVALCGQIADALETAHLRGVVHRDLKPANVLLTPDGAIKVLDFGLARTGEDADATSPDATHSPTMTSPTSDGTLLGTAAYMCPEAVRGRAVGREADLWALGCVLYECLTARPAFGDATVSDTLARVLRSEPDWERLPAATPPRLRELIERCLAKDPAQRQRDAGDAALDLRAARSEPVPRKSRNVWPALLLFVAAIAAIGGWATRGPAEPAANRTIRATLMPPDGWYPHTAHISPDGSTVAIVAMGQHVGEHGAVRRAFVRQLDRDDAFVMIDATLESLHLRFSPDSKSIAIQASGIAGVTGPALVRAPADGSQPPSLIHPWNDAWLHDFVWNAEGQIVLIAILPQRIVRIPVDGGEPIESTELRLGESERFLLQTALEDGTLLGTIESWQGGYHQDVAHLDPATGEVTLLVDRAFEPTLLGEDRLLFSRRDQLMTVSFDPATLAVGGAPQVVATGLRTEPSSTAARFSLSGRGDLVHVEGGLVGFDRSLAWIEEDGSRTPWGDVRGPIVEGDIDDSQDGRVLAYVQIGATGLYEVWASEVDDPAPRRLLAHDGMDCDSPVVSPEGSRIAARCRGQVEHNGIYIARFPQVGERGVQAFAAREQRLYPRSWTPDGSALFVRVLAGNDSSIALLPVDEEGVGGEIRSVEGLEGDVGFAMVSPDSALVAFTRWNGQAWVLHVAPWDGERAGPARPILETGNAGFDWTGVRREEAWELATSTRTLEPRYALIGADGRLLRVEPIRDYVRDADAIMGTTYFSDGRVLVLEPDPAEVAARGIRLVTDWARDR